MKNELWIIYEGNEFIPFVGDNSHGFWESSPVMYQSVEWDAGCFLFVLFLCGMPMVPGPPTKSTYT